jgi:hypothetical protein
MLAKPWLSVGVARLLRLIFQLLFLSGESVYEIRENTFKETFFVMISNLFSHDAYLLQEHLI